MDVFIIFIEVLILLEMFHSHRWCFLIDLCIFAKKKTHQETHVLLILHNQLSCAFRHILWFSIEFSGLHFLLSLCRFARFRANLRVEGEQSCKQSNNSKICCCVSTKGVGMLTKKVCLKDSSCSRLTMTCSCNISF